MFRGTEVVSKGLIIKYVVFPEACFSSYAVWGPGRTYMWGLNITTATFFRSFFGEWMELHGEAGWNRAFEGE